MPSLDRTIRRQLENTVKQARRVAENGARKAIEQLAVPHHEPWPSMSPDQRQLRNRLRAHGRQLGDRRDERRGTQTMDRLVGACAYEHWHRMLFARFLAENSLLIEPDSGLDISLQDCRELAREQRLDWLELASSYAVRMLPQIFRREDPVLEVGLPPETRSELEDLLKGLPPEVFLADDSLGWVYQFWQADEKKAINDSERKIGAEELPAVTQLFTEDYMVEFLLHNTLGAWWAGKVLHANPDLAKNAKSEEELRSACGVGDVRWTYLRFVREGDAPWRPASGTFEGWPKAAKDIKVLDPCCGSGHFLVAVLRHLVPIRMAEENLSDRDAIDAVLRDNLHGLEIDERCCQIAAFTVAFAAWTYSSGGGYRPLPELHIACSGLAPQCPAEEWLKLVEESGIHMPTLGREPIKNGLLNLHDLFSQAPLLGSLINPADVPSNLIAADYETLHPYLAQISRAEKATDETRERAIAAAGMVKATDLLARNYTLLITNVPYLEQRKQTEELRSFCQDQYPQAKGDIASVFVERSIGLLSNNGTSALVTPQNWLYLTTYGKLRVRLLKTRKWQAVGKLGHSAFGTISGHVVQPVLIILSEGDPDPSNPPFFLDVSTSPNPEEKSNQIRTQHPVFDTQESILGNPDARVVFGFENSDQGLGDHTWSLAGIMNGDSPKFLRVFWEVDEKGSLWAYQQTTVESTRFYGGMTNLVFFDETEGHLRESPEVRRSKLHNSDERGNQVWGRRGVAITQMSNLPVALYDGHKYDSNIAVVSPFNENHVPAILAFCTSAEFISAVRELEPKMNVTNATFGKLPFDLSHWQDVAEEKYPNGLPEPESDDPTQWLFHGRPEESTASLQVAVARLLGYRWPAEVDEKMRLSNRARTLVKRCGELDPFTDRDGIVCLSPIAREEPAAARLRALLAAAFGSAWSAAKERELLAASGSTKTSLEEWLLDEFFEQHSGLFHNRPFIWHIWDGRRDGFNALVNYHKLAAPNGEGRRMLEKLIYTYVGDWIAQQRRDQQAGVEGSDARVAAASHLQEELKKIRAGEPPYDLFIRWKPLSEQPIGWDPDINDGVRLNIRPFVTARPLGARSRTACILRTTPSSIKWTKDRGKEPTRPKEEYPWFWSWDEKTQDFPGGKEFDGARWNDCHYTNKVKQAAREKHGSKEAAIK